MNKSIVLIADPRVLAVKIHENNEPLVNVKNRLAVGEPPECPETKPDYTWVRKTVFDKLLLVQESLPQGWFIRLYEGFRSLEVQDMLYADIYAKMQKRFPTANEDELFHHTIQLVSPITNQDGSSNIPAHNTGAAVDVEIIDEHGQLIDMGMAAKDWRTVDPELCKTECNSISNVAQTHRKRLCEHMAQQGFVNYPTEWWHFSYGDRYWAYHSDVEYACYGSADTIERKKY